MTSTVHPHTDRTEWGARRLFAVGFLGWLATIGVDLFFHAGVFAGVFFESSPFLLAPTELFVRIPLGYLAFLLMTALLVWLMARLSVSGLVAGARFGLSIGAVVHGGSALGLASVSTASSSFIVVWFVGQTVQAGVAGAVIGRGLAVERLTKLAASVVVLVVVLVVITVAAQSPGVVPTPV